ncbi:MAG: glycosidase, partial [bacterium]|nr:glycosidase [bacterium]
YTAFKNGNRPVYPDDAPRSLKENLTRTGLLRSRDLRSFESLGPITRDDTDDRDVIIFPEMINNRYVMLHRPAEWTGSAYGTKKPGIWMAFSRDMLHWGGDILLAQPEFEWQSEKVGGSTPPVRTKYGWLVMYHGVDKKRVYRQGLMMLDLDDPARIVARPDDFILEPAEEFEVKGVEHDVVFAVGNIVKGKELFVYYGGADKVCCVATARLDELVDYVMSYQIK